jgi:hypothetical protein
MLRSLFNSLFILLAGVAIFALFFAAVPAAAQEQVITSFNSSPGPDTGVAFDAAGNIYGTQAANVYKLTPQSGGGWSQSVIYSFPASKTAWGTLAIDDSGNLAFLRRLDLVFQNGTPGRIKVSSHLLK